MAGRRTIVWLEPSQVDFVRAVARAAGLEIVGAGSPNPPQSGAVSSALGCPTADDLRAALASGACECLWIARAGDFGRGESDSVAVREAIDRGVKVVASDPVPGNLLAYASSAWSEGASTRPTSPVLIPVGRDARALREAHEPLATLGGVRAGFFQLVSHRDQATLGALLFAGIDMLRASFGDPETVDAAYVGPGAARATDGPGESLTGLSGSMTLNLRFADGRAAALLVSDQCGEWALHVVFVGEAARLTIDDRGMEWLDARGRRYDPLAPPAGLGEPTLSPGVVEWADAVGRILDPALAARAGRDLGGVLAIAHAALLSATTRSAERPSVIQRMLGAHH
jgi:hypothetical protein